MLKYKALSIDFENEDSIWEAFVGFWNLYLSNVLDDCERLGILTEIQKNLIIFNYYRGSVLRGGHQVFLDLYMDSIGIKAVIDSSLALGFSDELIAPLECIFDKLSFLDTLDDDDKEKIKWELEERENFFEPINCAFYKYCDDGIIDDKMIQYLRENATEFFEEIA